MFRRCHQGDGRAPAWCELHVAGSPRLGAQLTWTLPFGLLIMFAVFNRFDRRYEEAARDLGATPVADASPCGAADHRCPASIGVGLFGFTLS